MDPTPEDGPSMTHAPPEDRPVDPEVRRRFTIAPRRYLAGRLTHTWQVERGGRPYVLKSFGPGSLPDWPYQLLVGEALRRQGWPAPAPVEEPLTTADAAWVLFDWLPGVPRKPTDAERPAEERARGRLLAEFHAAAAATGITSRRQGFPRPRDIVADPELERWLRVHERFAPGEGAMLRRYREASAAWFEEHPDPDVPSSVIHGDFTPWNLLFDGDRLSGVLDLEGTHHSFQTADFALSWRGYHDDVLRGYDEVRPLSALEWQTLRPVFWSWLFLGVAGMLAGHYGGAEPDRPADLEWTSSHLQKVSGLLDARLGPPVLPG
jgi:Ser/Thr protein kinase RdoA (MazF antagonist)